MVGCGIFIASCGIFHCNVGSVVACGLSCPSIWNHSSPTRDWTHFSSINQWTTRDQKRYCYSLCQGGFCLFSSKSLILFGLKFRCLNHLSLFFCMVFENVLILLYFFMWLSSVSAPFNEETVSSPLYIFASFVIEYITTGVCVCFWTLYPVPLVYISGFVPVAYCFE